MFQFRDTVLLLLSICATSLAAQTPAPAASINQSPDISSRQSSRIGKIQSCVLELVLVKGEPVSCRTLAQRMAELHASGVSIALVHNGVLEWAEGFGVQQTGGHPVTPETLFQAGSISKPLAAMAALHLVQQNKLSLDADINSELTSWKVPAHKVAPGAVVTLRQLLTHTAGFTVHGFPGYAAGAPVPTLVQILNGEKPANTGPIRVETAPDTKWNYSGGGYTVMQQAVVDATKEPFFRTLQTTVLTPIGMAHSTYQQPLPSDLLPTAATPYKADGSPIPGGPHTYPEMAAAGLWTTPSDLARYILEVQQSLKGKANHVLSQQLTEEMLKPGKGNWGLGLNIGGASKDPYFSHGGVNEGFESLFVGYEHSGEGAVVMTNAQGGTRLASELMATIATAYQWPDFQPKLRTTVKVAPATLARYVGSYQVSPNFILTFTLDGDRLLGQAGPEKFPLFSESETKFFLKAIDAEIEFFPGEHGDVPYLMLHQDGQNAKAVRR